MGIIRGSGTEYNVSEGNECSVTRPRIRGGGVCLCRGFCVIKRYGLELVVLLSVTIIDADWPA